MLFRSVTGNGTIELTSTSNDTSWAKSSTIFHNRGGVLTVENGTYKHLGGTCMAFVIDNSANSFGDATTTIKGGALDSTYIAIRNRMEYEGGNGNANGIATLNVAGGTITGASRAIWAQASSASVTSPARGEINVTGGEIGLIDTARSAGATSMTTISGGKVSAFKGEIGELTVENGTLENVTILDASGAAVDYAINANGTYVQAVVKIGTTAYATLAEAVAAAQNGDEIVLLADVAISETIKINANVTLDLNGKTIVGTDNSNGSFALFEIQPGKEFTIVGEGKITLTATNNRGWGGYSSIVSVQRAKLTVNGGTLEHLGGTDMAYAIDVLTNTGAGNADRKSTRLNSSHAELSRMPSSA